MATRRKLTPVDVLARFPGFRTGRMETWAARSRDRVWTFERTEEPSTPWVVTHEPTGRWAYMSSLPEARAFTASGRMLAYLDARDQVEARNHRAA